MQASILLSEFTGELDRTGWPTKAAAFHRRGSIMNIAVDKIMEARNYDGVASKLKADTAKKTAQKTAANGSDDALKTMFPFMADFAK